jgi:hypothetical protein
MFGNSILNVASNIWCIHKNTGFSFSQIINQIFIIVLGDDNACMVPKFYPDMDVSPLDALGQSITLVKRPNSFDLTFCSAYFYPVNDGICLSPKIGRFVPKFSWYLDMPDKKLYSTHLATIQSVERDVAHIPPIRHLVAVQKKLLLNKLVKPIKITDKKYQFHKYLHVSNKQFCSDETWHFLDYHYGWNQGEQTRLEQVLDSITTIPCVLPSDLFSRFIQHDGEVHSYSASIIDYTGTVDLNRVKTTLFFLLFCLHLNALVFDVMRYLKVIGYEHSYAWLFWEALCFMLYFKKMHNPPSFNLFILLSVLGEELIKRFVPYGNFILPFGELLLTLYTCWFSATGPLWQKIYFSTFRLIIFIRHSAWTSYPFLLAVVSHSVTNLLAFQV